MSLSLYFSPKHTFALHTYRIYPRSIVRLRFVSRILHTELTELYELLTVLTHRRRHTVAPLILLN